MSYTSISHLSAQQNCNKIHSEICLAAIGNGHTRSRLPHVTNLLAKCNASSSAFPLDLDLAASQLTLLLAVSSTHCKARGCISAQIVTGGPLEAKRVGSRRLLLLLLLHAKRRMCWGAEGARSCVGAHLLRRLTKDGNRGARRSPCRSCVRYTKRSSGCGLRRPKRAR